MRPATLPCFLFSLLGLLPLAGYSAARKKAPADRPPVLISKDGDKEQLLDAPPVRISTAGAKPKWKNVEQLRKFAAKGDPQACFELAERFLYGDEVPKDLNQAVPLLEQAGQGGIADAWFRLGKIYHDGLLGAPDYERTLDYYARAARAGVPEAQHNIGAMLVSARGVKRDLVEGLAWLIVATRTGAVSGAEGKVRDQLAKRPVDLRTAEARATELSQNLAAAEVRAVLEGARTTPAAIDETRKVPAGPAIAIPIDKPVIKAPPIDPPTAPTISLPALPPPKLSPPDKP
jgi:TPR repeat protein